MFESARTKPTAASTRRSLLTVEGSDWTLNPNNYTIEGVANTVRRFMYEERYAITYKEVAEPPVLGFLIAGYSSGEALPEEYELVLAAACGAPKLLRNKDEIGVAWWGQPEALTRLIFGFSGMMGQVLKEDLGVPDDQIEPALSLMRAKLQFPFVQPAMPIQEAIDLARFLVELATMVSRFLPGWNVVGGPTEVAAITKHEHFKWISRKHYYGQELNPEVKD